MRRYVAVAIVLGATVLAAASVGNGNVTATPAVSIILTPGGSGSAQTTLHNTTAGAIVVDVSTDDACDPGVDFSLAGPNPFTLPALSQAPVTLQCAMGAPGMQRCLVHVKDANTGDALVDLLAVCEHAGAASLVPTSTSLDFGTVVVGDAATMSVDLQNAGATTITKLFLQTTDLDDDFEISIPCNPDSPGCDGTISPVGPGANATVYVKCSPRTPGTHTAELEVATDTSQHVSARVQLMCIGSPATLPVLGVMPPAVVVSNPVEVVSGTAHPALHLTNNGTGIVQITDVRTVDVDTGAAADWALSIAGTCTGIPCSLPAGQQVSIDLTFDPSAIGARHASLLLSFHDTIDRTRSIPLLGVGQGATLARLGPNLPLDLGTVPIGRMSSLDFQLVNRGNRATTPSLSSVPVPFSLMPSAMITVDPIAPATVTTTCAPGGTGTAMTQITAQPSDTITTTPVTVTATCTGSLSLLYANPTAISLGEIRTNAGPLAKSFQLLSTGAAQTFTGTPHLETANSNVMVGSPSTGMTPASLDVTIDPQGDGDIKTRVLVDDTAGDTLAIPITGRVVTASYSVPDMVDLGTFCVGQPTASSNVSLTVDGTATIAVAQPSVAATSGFELSLSSPTLYPASVASAQHATVSVTPLRQAAATTLDANMTWTTDVEDKPTSPTEIIARFIDTGGAIAPPLLDFGAVPVHLFTDDGQRVMIQNCNSSLLELDAPNIRAPFSIDSPNFPTTLLPNETAIFSVGFHPTRLGAFADTLTISSPQLAGAPLQVALVGETATNPAGSDGGMGSGTPGETSFYACSCTSSDPGSALLVVLAIGFVIVRRRCGSS